MTTSTIVPTVLRAESAGVTDVVGAWQHVAQLMTVIALKQRLDQCRDTFAGPRHLAAA